MSIVLDGVIFAPMSIWADTGAMFARKSNDAEWVPWKLTKGPRKGHMVQKNIRTGAIRDLSQEQEKDHGQSGSGVAGPGGSGRSGGGLGGDSGAASGGIDRSGPGGRTDAPAGVSGSRSPGGSSRIITARPGITRQNDTSLVPQGLRGLLAEHQLQTVAGAIAAIDAHGGYLIASGTGAGKTRSQIALAKTYADRGKKVLIVTKNEVIRPDWAKGTVTGSFDADSKLMGISLQLNKGDMALQPGMVNVTTYDRLGQIKDKVDKDTILLFDESHSLKNWGSARSKQGYEMSKAAGAVVYSTATPADKPLHITHLFRSRIFGFRKWEETYKEMGLRQRTIRGAGGRTIKKWEVDPSVGAAEVYRRMAGLFDRLTADGLMIKHELSFDGVDVKFQRIKLPPEAHQAMATIEKATAGGSANPGLGRAMTLMHQRRQQETYKIPATVEMAQNELAEGRQVVIFMSRVSESGVGDPLGVGQGVYSAGTADLLQNALENAGVPAEQIANLHGGVSAGQRKRAAADFQSGKARVIIATPEAGGTGINLDDTTGNNPRTMIVVTSPFSAVENVQMAGRVWRLTTASAPRLRYLFGDTEVDDWNASLIAGKMKTLGAAVGGEVSYLDIPTLDVSEEEGMETAGSGALQQAASSEPYPWPSLVRPPAPPAPTRPATPASLLVKPAAEPPPGAEPEAYISETRRQAIHAALRHLAARNTDYASAQNDIGYNRMDTPFGMDLAQRESLTDRQALAAARMLAKYRGQLGDELHRRVTTAEDRPAPPPLPPTPPTPATSPPGGPPVATRQVNTSRGQRHVHSFAPTQAFWQARRDGRLPNNISVGKNPRTGNWEASIWGNTPDEVQMTHASLRSANLV